MKVILLVISCLFIAAGSASVIPVDQSSATVKVKQGDTEYSYSINDGRGIAPEKQPTVLPPEADELPQQILVTTLQPDIGEVPVEISRQANLDPVQEKDARFIARPEEKEIENQSQEKMVISMPVDRMIKSVELEGIEHQPLEEVKMSKLTHRDVKGLENQPQEELRISVPAYRELKGLELKAIESQPQEELKVLLPGYRLIPTTNIQYIDQPLYYPYYPLYGHHYPNNFVRYI